MSFIPKPPYARTRKDGAITRPSNVISTYHNFGTNQGTYTDVLVARVAGYTGSRRQTHDVVTPGYARMRNEGQILNNPFQSIKVTCSYSGTGPTVVWIAPTSPWPAGSTQHATHVTSRLHFDSEFALGPIVDSEDNLILPPSIVDVDFLLRKAKTAALAKVDRSKAQSLVGLAELRQTLLSLINPLASIRAFTDRFVWRYNFRTKKYGWQVKQGDGLTPAVANQYLAFYYGLLPFMRDIESYIDAYVAESLHVLRETARSGAEDTDVSVRTVLGSRSVQNVSQYDLRFTRTDTVSVRAGILYEPTAATYKKLFGLRAADFFGSVYQAMPWSFFIDYFSNLGTTIEALTPRVGVSYLASWETLRYTIKHEAETLTSYIQGSFVHSKAGNEKAERIIEACVRSPVSPYVNVGPVAFSGVWDSKAKVGAVLSLTIQQLAKRVPFIRGM